MPDGSRSFADNDPGLRQVAQLYREHYTFVWRVLRRSGVPEAELDDGAQETFLVVYRKLGEFEGRASERTWLYAIALRVASTLRRSRKREVARRERAGQDVHGRPAVDPEGQLADHEAAEVLRGLLDRLDEGKRRVFVLAELEGIKVPEIAKILGMNANTVQSRLRLARRRFATALQVYRAQETGRSSARLRRELLHARSPAPSQTARQTSWAALAIRIEQGAKPLLPGWQSLSLGSAGALVGPTGIGTTVWMVLGFVGVVSAGAVVWAAADRASEPSPGGVQAPEKPVPEVQAALPRATLRSPAPVPSPALTEPKPPVLTPQPATGLQAAVKLSRTAPATQTLPLSDGLAEETVLLERARAALSSGDPQAALRSLARHEKRFPNGVLAEERRASQLRGLCAAGQRERAAVLAAQWQRQWTRRLAVYCPVPD